LSGHAVIDDLIGNTPLVQLRHRGSPGGPRVCLKMEQFNPGGSVKDRTALGMLRYEERRGSLHSGMTIVESSSGNTAIGLAILAQARGYRVIAICDRHVPMVKRSRLRAFGADIVFLPETPVGLDTVELRIAVADRLSLELDGAITLGQYSHPGNPEIHSETTGPEIYESVKGDVAAVVAAVGTCGTISGVGRALKDRDPRIQVIGVEPEGSVIFGGPPGRYLVQGGGLSFVPSIFDRSIVDEGLKISDEEAIGALHELALLEGWLLGGTAGLVIAALRRIAPRFGPRDTIVGIVPDAGDRYIDTLFDTGWLEERGIASQGGGDGPDDAARAAVDELGCSFADGLIDNERSLDDVCSRLNLALHW
jgi:cystathionine beta-synthase